MTQLALLTTVLTSSAPLSTQDLIALDKSTQTLKSLASATLPDAGVALATYGRSIYIAIDSGIKTFFCKSATLKPASRFHHDVRVSATVEQTAVDTSTDGKILALAADDGSVVVLSMPRYKILFKGVIHSDGITDLNLSNDGRIACTTAHDRRALVWDTRSGAVIQSITPASITSSKTEPVNPTPGRRPPPPPHVRSLRLAAAGTLLFAVESGRSGGFLSVWRATGSAPAFATAAVLRITSEAVTGLAVNESGTSVAVATSEGHVCILRYSAHTGLSMYWRTDHMFFKRGIPPHVLPITGMCFTQDGARLVTASADRSVALWDFEHQPTRRPLIWLLITLLIIVFALCTVWIFPSIAFSKHRRFNKHPPESHIRETEMLERTPRSLRRRAYAWQFWKQNTNTDICWISGESLTEPPSYESPRSTFISEYTLTAFGRKTSDEPDEAEGGPSESFSRTRKNRRRSKPHYSISSSQQNHQTQRTESAEPRASDPNFHEKSAHDLGAATEKKRHVKQPEMHHQLTGKESTPVPQLSDVRDLETVSPDGLEYGKDTTPLPDTYPIITQPKRAMQSGSQSPPLLNEVDDTAHPSKSTQRRARDSGTSKPKSGTDKENSRDDERITMRPGHSNDRQMVASHPEETPSKPGKRRNRKKRVLSSSRADQADSGVNPNNQKNATHVEGGSLHKANETGDVKQLTPDKNVEPKVSYLKTNNASDLIFTESLKLNDEAGEHKFQDADVKKAFGGASSPIPSSSVSAIPTTPSKSRFVRTEVETGQTDISGGTRDSSVARSANTDNTDSCNFCEKKLGSLSFDSQFCTLSPYPQFLKSNQPIPHLNNRPRRDAKWTESQLSSSRPPSMSTGTGTFKGGNRGEIVQSTQETPSARVKVSGQQAKLRVSGNADNSREIQDAVNLMLASLGSDRLSDTKSDDTVDPNQIHLQPPDKVTAVEAMTEVTGCSEASVLLMVRLGFSKNNRCLKDCLRLNEKYQRKWQKKRSSPASGIDPDEPSADSTRTVNEDYVSKPPDIGAVNTAKPSFAYSFRPRTGVCNRRPSFIRGRTAIKGKSAGEGPGSVLMDNSSEPQSTRGDRDDSDSVSSSDSVSTTKLENTAPQDVAGDYVESESLGKNVGKRIRRRRRGAGKRF